MKRYGRSECYPALTDRWRLYIYLNGNIFDVTGPLGGEFTGHRWIPNHKSQWCGALKFSLICAWTNGWVTNRNAGDLRRHRDANRPVSQMRAPSGACREPAGSYDKTTRAAICFEHKTQYLLICAPYTRIVVFWHISNISPMISQSQTSCNTPTFCIAAIFVNIAIRPAVGCYNSWANLRCSGCVPLGENYCETGQLWCHCNDRSKTSMPFSVRANNVM